MSKRSASLFKQILIVTQLLTYDVLAANYQRHDDLDVVIDNRYGLMWQDDLYSSRLDMPFSKAIEYCETLKFAGFDDWSLPHLDALKSLIQTENYPLSIDKTFKYTASEYYWSDRNYKDKYAWIVLFRNGSIEYYYKTDTNHLRCVRVNK